MIFCGVLYTYEPVHCLMVMKKNANKSQYVHCVYIDIILNYSDIDYYSLNAHHVTYLMI